MRQARSQVISGTVEKNLRFVFEPTKSARVDNPCTVSFVTGSQGMRRLLDRTSSRLVGPLRVRGQRIVRQHIHAKSARSRLWMLSKPPFEKITITSPE